MNEDELFDQFLDALRRDLNAAPPPELDAENAAFIRALVAAERNTAPAKSIQDRVWHKALSLAQSESDVFARPSSKNGQVEQKLTYLKSTERMGMEAGDPPTHESSDLLPIHQTAPGTRPPTVRSFWQYTLTIAAAILILAFLGGLLIEMMNDPKDGYLSPISPTEELTPEATPGCNSSTDYLTRGEDLLSSGSYEAAAAAYACAIEINPTDYTAYVWRGGLAAAKGDYDQLGYDLYGIFSHRTSGSDAMTLNLVKTIPKLTAAIESRPDDPTLYLLRGLAAFVADLRSNALKDFEELKRLAPENAAGYLLHWETQPADKLLTDEDFKTGSELAPGSALTDWAVSVNYVEANVTGWWMHYDEAIQRNPEHPFAYEARGIAHVYRGDNAAASADFYQHIQLYQGESIEEYTLELGKTFNFDAVTGQVYRLTFEASMGQKLNIVPSRGYSALNWIYPPTLVVLDPDGEVMDAPYSITGTGGAATTPIRGLDIWTGGTYTVLVTPNVSGPMTLTVSVAR
jgi:tetratricopeptide (TPR) repeat protein